MKFFVVLIAFATAIGAFFTGPPTVKIILYAVSFLALALFSYLQLRPRNNDRHTPDP